RMNKRIGIIMHGVTGRMGMNQHLVRSILEIRKQGGVALKDGTRLMPDPILVGRNAAKVEELARKYGIPRWTADLEGSLKNRADEIFFDAASTQLRPKLLKQAIAAGKHVYCEKPVATTLAQAVDLYKAAKKARIKHGVVQDKLWLPGMLKLAKLRDQGFFGATHIPHRWDENGKKYKATADDAAYATFKLAGGAIAHFNSSWTVRVRRDDLLTLQVDGTKGSAVAGLRDCYIQHYGSTPRPVWNPDIDSPLNYFDGWQKVPEQDTFDNAFKRQWEMYLRHVVKDE